MTLLRRLSICVLGITLGTSLVAGCSGKKPEEQEEAKTAPVKAVRADEASFGQWTEILGTTLPLPNHSARVTAAVEGRVQSLLSDASGHPLVEGQHVEAGQVIAKLDDHVARANRDKLAAALKEFEQQKVQGDIDVKTAQIDVNRYEKLSRDPTTAASLSPIDVEKANLALQKARSLRDGIEAKQQSAQADLRAVDAQLELYTLRAPISGRLGAIQVQRGQTLAPGTLVTEVIDLDEIDALCFVTPETASHLHLEQTALILPESSHGDGPVLLGEVVYIAVQAHPDTGNFAVKVRFSNRDASDRLLRQAFTFVPGIPIPLPNHNHALRSNSVVTVHVLTEPVDERLSIPDEALLEDHDPPNVIVIQTIKTKGKDDEQEQLRKVAKILQARLGVRDRQQHRVEILGLVDPESKKPVALHEDAEKRKPLFFVTEGGHGLKDGDSVKIEEEKEEKEEKE